MKHVFRNAEEVAHIWAQQLPEQEHARCGNASYDGKVFYSYRTTIARFLTNDVVCVTRYNYSHTTNSHIRDVLRSVNHKTVVRVPDYVPYHLQDAANRIANAAAVLQSPTIANYRSQKLWESELKKIAEIDSTITIPEITFCLTEEQVAKKEAIAAKRSERSTSSDEAFYTKLREILATSGDNKEEWRNHQPLTGVLIQGAKVKFKENGKTYTRTIPQRKWDLPDDLRVALSGASFNTVLLRVSKDAENIETSLGAKVTVREAKVLYELLKRGSDINGFRIGYYTVIGKTEDHIKIGCHTILFSEVELLAQKLGWVS